MRRASKLILITCRAVAAMALPASANSADEDVGGARLASAVAPIETRRTLDFQIQAWFTDRKSLPETQGVAACVSDQLHIQALSDDGARAVVAALYAVGPGSDPSLDRLSSGDRDRLKRAAELCGVKLPGEPS